MQYVNANGTQVPAIGFGTFRLEPDDAQAMVEHALKIGYRHVDTAQAYKNEDAVGRGIQASGVARDDIFLTTKVWTDRYKDGDLQQSVRESLDRLGTDHVDLLLLHWPNPEVSLEETIKALNDVADQGLARHIGISNFTAQQIDEAVELSNRPLITNQVEYHPFLDQKPVFDRLQTHGLALTAYCPLAQGKTFSDATLERIGKAHDKNGGQIALRWLLQHGDVIAIPRSSSKEHVTSNFDVFDFELSAEEMREIATLHSDDGRLVSPSFAPKWDNAA